MLIVSRTVNPYRVEVAVLHLVVLGVCMLLARLRSYFFIPLIDRNVVQLGINHAE